MSKKNGTIVFYEEGNIRIEIEENEIPWLKVFTRNPYREMSHVPRELRYHIYDLLQMIEEEMIAYYHPDKINIASFGNYLPHVHWHIMARFESDSYFPEPMWGEKQRKSTIDLPPFDTFADRLLSRLREENLV